MYKNEKITFDFNEILQNSIEGILILQDGFIKSVNNSLLEILGYESQNDLIDKLATGVLIPTSTEKFIKYNKKVFQEITLITKNGKTIPVIIKMKDILINNQELKIIYVLDLTEIKEKENMVIFQSKLSSMGEMISMIAHQWRQPLSTITAILTRMKLRNNLNKIDKDYLEENLSDINKYIQYMSSTIDLFRNFNAVESKKELISLNEILMTVYEMLEKPLMLENIKIQISQTKLEQMFLPKNELIQVILNIINNAKDAFIERNIQNPIIKIDLEENKDFQTIFIEDNAGGINNEIISEIFNPYFSTKSKKNGTGLGLYICKNILEKDNLGDIFVENTQHGVKFTINIY